MSKNTDIALLEKEFTGKVQSLIKYSGKFNVNLQSFLNDLFSSVITYNVRWSHINDLYNGLPEKSLNKKAVKSWIQRYTPLKWNEELKAFTRTKSGKWDIAVIEAGMLNPWYNYEAKEKAVSVKQWNKEKNLLSLKKSTEKLLALANNAGDDESIRLLQSIIASL
jgi:hypothetical protein